MRLTALRSAIFGFAAFCIGILWIAAHETIARLHDPPGSSVDREIYLPAAITARCGLLLFLLSGAWAIVARIRRKHSPGS